MVVVIGTMIVFLILLLISNVKIISTMVINQQKQSLSLSVHLYGIQMVKRDINLGDQPQKSRSWKEVIDHLNMITSNFEAKIKRYSKIAAILLRPIVFRRLEWETYFGTGDAAATGMLAGSIWTVKGTITGLLSEKCTLSCEPVLAVNPLFNQRLIHSQLECIVTIRIGKAIYAFMKTMRLISVKKQAFI